jgi:hypothetical protein
VGGNSGYKKYCLELCPVLYRFRAAEETKVFLLLELRYFANICNRQDHESYILWVRQYSGTVGITALPFVLVGSPLEHLHRVSNKRHTLSVLCTVFSVLTQPYFLCIRVTLCTWLAALFAVFCLLRRGVHKYKIAMRLSCNVDISQFGVRVFGPNSMKSTGHVERMGNFIIAKSEGEKSLRSPRFR